jgi:HAE1 family hydrophobic/amphiphilic exporter-1
MLLSALLESFVQPLIILLTVPLSFIGIFPFLYVTGNTINILSMMAIVMIVGIVVNNGILIMDYTNLLHKGGMKVNEALLQACPIKLKPIIMSNLAIIMGMTPTALGLGEGAEFRAPLAIASIGGLISSTIFTLFLVPTVYSIYVRLWEWLCGTFGKDKTCDYER